MNHSLVRALLGRVSDTGLIRTLERARDFSLFAEHADPVQWRRFRNAAVSEGGLPLREVLSDRDGADAGSLTEGYGRGTTVAN